MCKSCKCSSLDNVKQIVVVADKKILPIEFEALQKNLLELSGVYHVHIDFDSGKTKIDYCPSRTDLRNIVKEFKAVIGSHSLVSVEIC